MSNILRQRLAAGQTIAGDHPDLDVLSAFAERSLQKSERDGVLAHLGVCSECRQAVALALPEMEQQVAALGTHASRFNFRTPWRWASAAAALAVAAGVGTLMYQHEGSRHVDLSNVASISRPSGATPAEKDAAVPTESNVPAAPNAATRRETVKRLPARERRTDRVTLAANLPEASSSNDRQINAVNRSENNAVAPAITAAQPALPVLDSRLNATALDQSSVSQNEIAEQKIAPTPLISAAPAPSAMQYNSAPATQTTASVNVIAVESGAPMVSESFTAPLKTSGFSAMGGATMKRSAAAFTDMVAWTITTAGKLQRQFRGAVKLVEPAPGVVVRAVAARGIEVWAGGSQPDLSAKQWQQAPALFHSSDAGETWTRVDGPWHGQIARVSLVTPASVTVVTQDGTWVTHDAGKTWTAP